MSEIVTKPLASPVERFGRVPPRAAKVRKARVLQVLIAISSYADRNGVAFPSMKTIAKDTGIDRGDIPRLVAEAEREGLMRVTRRGAAGNVYQIIYQAGANLATSSGVGSETDGGVGFPTDSGVGFSTDLTYQTNKLKITDREKGTRLKRDWEPNAEEIAFADQLGLDPRWTADKYRDHWLAKTGAEAAKCDWSAAWRGWCRREAEYNQRMGGGVPAMRYGNRLGAIATVPNHGGVSPALRQESTRKVLDDPVESSTLVLPVSPLTAAARDLADRLGEPGEILYRRIRADDFVAWFHAVEVERRDREANILVLTAPTAAVAEKLRSWYLPDIRIAWAVFNVEVRTVEKNVNGPLVAAKW